MDHFTERLPLFADTSFKNGFSTETKNLTETKKEKYPSKRAASSFEANFQLFRNAIKTVFAAVLSMSTVSDVIKSDRAYKSTNSPKTH